MKKTVDELFPYSEHQTKPQLTCMSCGKKTKKGDLIHKISSFAMTTLCNDCFKKAYKETKYDTDMTREQKIKLLQRVRDEDGGYIKTVFYGYEEPDRLNTCIEDVVNDFLEHIEELNADKNEKEPCVAPETMKIGVYVPKAFPKYYKDIHIEYIADNFEDDCETREYQKGIYLDRIFDWVDEDLKEEYTTKNEITPDMWAAEFALYTALKKKDNKEAWYSAEKALHDAIENDYEVGLCEEIGRVEVRTVDYAYDEHKHLIKGVENE